MSKPTADFGVVIAAGGCGKRAGAADLKQFRLIAGVPMLLRAIRPFASHSRVREVVVALPPSFAAEPPAWLGALVGERLDLVVGGETRAESVARGVDALGPECRGVLIHDAARPFVRRETVDAIVAHVAKGTCAVAAVPVSDTLKRSEPGATVVAETVDRRGLWRAQTPQGFPRDILAKVYGAGRGSVRTATDEATLVEAHGFTVELVLDSTSNMRITTSDDFIVAEALASCGS